MESKQQLIRSHLYISAEIKRKAVDLCVPSIEQAAEAIIQCFKDGKRVYIIGNGGSAADAQHLAAEFMSRFRSNFDRPGLPAIALTTDVSFITAYSNDVSFHGIFERQIKTLGQPGDILIAISTSGNSKNVIRATKAAIELRMITIGLTSQYGALGKTAQIVIAVPSIITSFIQETHLSIEHILCELVELELFPS